MRSFACKPIEDGGLGLFKDGPKQCKELFGQSPLKIIHIWPETDLNFLKLIEGKEHLLHQLAMKDLQQRSLVAETKAAIVNIGGSKNRINKRVLHDVLERCMFLLY